MRVGILADNCYEWILHDLALLSLSCVVVAFPPEEFATSSFAELADRYDLQLLLTRKKFLRDAEQHEWLGTLDTSDDRQLHLRQPANTLELEPDVCNLVFSSGTSGVPKCLQIGKTGTEVWLASCGRKYTFRPDDCMIVVLPFSNYQQRLMVYLAIWHGFDLVLTEPARFLPALKDFHPTILAGPPAFYELLENRFRNLPQSKQRLLLSVGGLIRTLTFGRWRQKLLQKWFSPFHSVFGNRVRIMITGGAPARHSTLELFAQLGLPLYEVYGLGETGFIALNLPGANRPGSVGKPMFEDAVIIEADGEIVVDYKVPLCLGYVGCDAETASKTFLSSGRIATGDLGKFDRDGYLYITGRKKQVIITAAGYKLQPELLEREIEKSPDVSRAVVFGGGELTVLVALISLNGDDDSRRRQRVNNIIEKLNATVPTPSQIGRTVFTTTKFTTDNGLLTRNLKIDRQAIYENFRGVLFNGSQPD
jgi:long-subunit acyl-CoA synthetase (AMP-forming)